ncbi:AAA family ATPase [Pseudomonas sp. LF19]|uniref:AAA family ATPase n=1 Tax=Pseudomonas sp. LF19 TaxID=2899115 RepID=UPI001F3A5A6D|nr:AAA family ATPase [Pseudomonas sp. LF19]MCE5981981.1 AAA family ATPase [Pseudomonas sp. LF19]
MSTTPQKDESYGITPASAWVRFLRSYGPTSNNLTMFDEYVSSALARAKVKPISLSVPLLEDMVRHIESKTPGSILIAGTAGDGKTYHCRALWERIGGDPKAWAAKGNVKELRLADGRTAVFIKDLSEFNGEESDLPLQRLERSVLEGDNSEVVILAANHGQILDRLRDLGRRQNRSHPIRKPLQERFLQAGPAPDRLAVFDLSRSTSRKTLDEVAKAVAGHPEWDNCQRCQLQSGNKVCPIDENRRRLLGESDGGQLSRRLGDLVEIARFNGLHLPMRDLLALCSNMVLGYSDAKMAKENLMTCADVAKIQEGGDIGKASIYTNAFGANLPKRRTADRPIFRAMSSFGVGDESTNTTDGLLVYGKDDTRLQADFDRLVGSDPIYGSTVAFMAAQDAYLEGYEDARLEGGSSQFLGMLEDQRRRLFYTLPDGELGYPHWSMTAFRFAGDYLEVIEALEAKKSIDEKVRGRIAKGLNRVLTGLLLENVDRIFIASSGGFTQSRVSVLCDHETLSRRQGGVGMAIKLVAATGLPQLDVSLAPSPGYSVTFDLTPIRHEFLSRVAEGALPASFSNECLEDLLAFKAKLLRKAENVRNTCMVGDDDDAGDEASALTLNFIEIEPGGRGFSRPVTVRIPE